MNYGGHHEEAFYRRADHQHFKEQEAGFPVKEITRRHGIAEQTFYRWKSKFGGMEVSDAKRLRELESENAKLKKLLAETMLGELPARLKRRKHPIRYNRPIPGDRVQMDVCKIGPGMYHYAAIDDCSHYKVLGLYPRRTAATTAARQSR